MNSRIVEAVARDGLQKNLKDILIACYDEIIARRIITVKELLSFLDDLDWDPKLEAVVRRAYALIREIHWGIFRDLDSEAHPQLWKALTVSNRSLPAYPDLKRNVVVPNVFCAVMDIHAYTEFCQKNRHNVSMLRTLDEVIQKDTREIAGKHGCLSFRSAGDNIIVVGSSPGAMLHACLGIVDSFSRKRVLEKAQLSESRKGNAVVMQDMNVTVGIAGGLRYHSLIVTQDGDISGSVVNTAARLQGFANTISPDQSKVIVSSHVYAGYTREQKKQAEDEEGLTFFNRGKISFKGTSVVVHELLYTKRDMKKASYQQAYTQLLEAARKQRWSDRLISQAVGLVIQVLEADPIPRVEIRTDGPPRAFSNTSLISMCREALALYESSGEHRAVSAQLQLIAAVLQKAPRFDPLVRTHYEQIVTLYERMTREFETLQYEKILENQTGLFNLKERSVIDTAARLEKIRDTLIERGKQHNNIYSSTVLWNKIVSDFEGKWEYEVYSGKK